MLRSVVLLLLLPAATASAAGRTPQENSAPPSPQCLIKGNVNLKGVRIYHPPGCRHYNETMIDPRRGERWFCSEAEAVAAGWRRTKVC
ncbi:MAG: succinoglycan biosynthesis protein exoi [Alphaproteobacteria bacterium]|nr:succinoglycan biosynthesis protein exoi [Alphaproteobacteria bacterium]